MPKESTKCYIFLCKYGEAIQYTDGLGVVTRCGIPFLILAASGQIKRNLKNFFWHRTHERISYQVFLKTETLKEIPTAFFKAKRDRQLSIQREIVTLREKEVDHSQCSNQLEGRKRLKQQGY